MSSRALTASVACTIVGVAFAAAACGPPELIFDDHVRPHDGPPIDRRESLHPYATDAEVTFDIWAFAPFADVSSYDVVFDGDLTSDESGVVTYDDHLQFTLVTGGEEGGALSVVDASGAVVETRDIVVREADLMTLSLPIETRSGWDAPAVALVGTRIVAGSKAAFRAQLSRDGEEIYGLRSVVATPTDASVTTRQGIACAPGGCTGQREAVEIQVPEGVTSPFDVALTAGQASLTLRVVPTTASDITSFTLVEIPAEERDVDISGNEKVSIVASSLVDDEPVFGAPVAWTLDGVAQETTGDLVRYFKDEGADPRPLVAALGPHTGSVEVRTSDILEISSVTAACSAGGGGDALPALALVLLSWSRRRRRAIPRA